jgi:hypothetical protein
VDDSHLSDTNHSRQVIADNPHGFTDETLARLRTIEDPAKRKDEEERLLFDRSFMDAYRAAYEEALRSEVDERNA